jgi:hypothetical protein
MLTNQLCKCHPNTEKDDAMSLADFRPISLVQSVAKILTKVLANRLAPHLATLVSPCQSAFIKGRNIQDNFQYIQGGDQPLPPLQDVDAIPQTRHCQGI